MNGLSSDSSCFFNSSNLESVSVCPVKNWGNLMLIDGNDKLSQAPVQPSTLDPKLDECVMEDTMLWVCLHDMDAILLLLYTFSYILQV